MNNRGFTLFELIMTLGLISLISASALTNLAALKSPLQSGAETTVGFIKQVRAKAAATTSAYFISVSGSNKFVTSYATNCSVEEESRTADNNLSLTLPTGVTISDTSWSSCYTSRGLASTGSSFNIQDVGNRTRTIEIFLGGAVRVN